MNVLANSKQNIQNKRKPILVIPISDSVMFEFIIAVVPNIIPDNNSPTNNDPANMLIDNRFDSVTD